jgi:hypothetical protein
MPRFTNEAKIVKTLKLLMSVQNPKILNLLRIRGFDTEDLHEGWNLFNTATGQFASLKNMKNLPGIIDINKLIAIIDTWENVWFEIAEAALRRKFPEICDELFLNLHKVSGISVIVNVNTLVNRIDSFFHNSEERYVNASNLLKKRGLNEQTLEEARVLLSQAESASFEELPEPLVTKETLDEARENMWKWYIDWSTTARTIIKSKSLKISMGISSPTPKKTE